MSMSKKDRRDKLSKIIEMQPPGWLNEETYNEYEINREQFAKEVRDDFDALIVNFFDFKVKVGELRWNQTWKSYSFSCSPEPLVKKYIAERIISNPTTGQDPKIYSGPNLRDASFHAGRHWGWTPTILKNGDQAKSESQWIEDGTFNLIKYTSGKVVMEPCNVEHRFWGLIGFPMGLVPVDAKEDLYFYDNNLKELYDEKSEKMIRRMKVNEMYIDEIVIEAKKRGCITTEDVVLNSHFYSNDFNYRILPAYGKEQCEEYFSEVNTSSQKSKVQMFHSSSEPIMKWMKDMASPKHVKFSPLGVKYHPLFELMTENDLVKLEALMYLCEVTNFVDGNYKAIDCTDDKLIANYNKTNGYANSFKSEKFKEEVIGRLDFLYGLISNRENPVMSRQLLQQLLLLDDYLTQNDFVIYDSNSFIGDFYDFYKNEQEDDNGNLTKFGRAVRTGTVGYMVEAHKHIKKNFLGLLRDERYLKKIGIVMTPDKLKRIFDKDIILDSLEANGGLDVDNKLLTTEPVGAHMISEMELNRLTEEERNQAFDDEGLGKIFVHNLNCRASSSHHNHRMGVLRLSEYLPIINNDELVKETRLVKYYKLKSMPILTK